jgi:hypothetical protein
MAVGTEKDNAKAAKKAAKAAAKAAKAQAKLEQERMPRDQPATQGTRQVASPGTGDGLTPQERAAAAAERSAAAAERQAHLQRYRVLYASLMVVIALATLAATLKPWEYLDAPPTTPPAETTTDGEESG